MSINIYSIVYNMYFFILYEQNWGFPSVLIIFILQFFINLNLAKLLVFLYQFNKIHLMEDNFNLHL